MPKILTLVDLPAKNPEQNITFNEGTKVSVTCSQSNYGGTTLRSNLCELDVNRNPRNSSRFPLKVIVRVKRLCTKVNSFHYIIDHRAECIFWIPHDSTHISNDCWEEFSIGSMVSFLDKCSHVYHEFCILKWVLTNQSCPYCRVNI